MYDYLEKGLKKFLTNHSHSNIENAGIKIWHAVLEDTGVSPKPKINVIFSRYQGPDNTETIMDKYGYVLAIPSYWIDVDFDLVNLYISNYVDAWIKKYFPTNNGIGSVNGGHVCHHPMPPIMPPPPPPPHHHHYPHPPHPPVVVDTNDPSKFGYVEDNTNTDINTGSTTDNTDTDGE